MFEQKKGTDMILQGYTGTYFNPDRSKGELSIMYWGPLPEKAQWDASSIICFSCISRKIPKLQIRGLCPGSYFDRSVFFLLDKDGFVNFYGAAKSHIGKLRQSKFVIGRLLNVRGSPHQ